LKIDFLILYSHLQIQYGNFDEDDVFLFTTDGVHCRTYEVRKEPSKKWYSHKHHGPGLTYLIGIATKTQRVVWIDGPHPASTHDVTIFRRQGGLGDQVKEGTRGIGDSAFSGEPEKIAISHPGERDDVAKMKARLKARHETFNARIKSFNILSGQFRHDIVHHGMAFEAVCVLVQYDMQNGNPLMER
jgi:DDE superfamily endonuclease